MSLPHSAIPKWPTDTDSAAFVLGPTSTSVTPSQLAAQEIKLEAFAYETKVFPLQVVDANGSPVDVSAKSLRFEIIPNDENPTAALLTVISIPVSGNDNNVATVTVAIGATVSAGAYKWRLWNTTDTVVLAHGVFRVLPAVNPA